MASSIKRIFIIWMYTYNERFFSLYIVYNCGSCVYDRIKGCILRKQTVLLSNPTHAREEITRREIRRSERYGARERPLSSIYLELGARGERVERGAREAYARRSTRDFLRIIYYMFFFTYRFNNNFNYIYIYFFLIIRDGKKGKGHLNLKINKIF